MWGFTSLISSISLYFSKRKANDTKILEFFSSGNDDGIIQLINNGINAQNYQINGSSLLHLSCEYGRIRLVEYLINKNCDLRLEDSQGNIPLYYACRNNHKDCIIFISRIDPSLLTVNNCRGCCPLDCISDYSIKDTIMKCNAEPTTSLEEATVMNKMYLPVLGEEHIPPMLEMLMSNIYTHPLTILEIRNIASQSKKESD